MSNVAVIGGGAAGLMAAYAAAVNQNSVTLFEKNEKCGKKIYITGKGRCNLTNACQPAEFLGNVVRNSKFLNSALYSFSPEDIIEFFENNGLKLKTERGARVFPVSDKASDVTKCLEKICVKNGVIFKLCETVRKLDILHSTICGITTDKGNYLFDKVIVCTGGLSYPSTGSTGDGYSFAKSAGHKITECLPALTGLNLSGNFYLKLQGLALKNVSLKIKYREKVLNELFGELLFTHFGASGPLILTASSLINRYDLANIILSIDMKPALSEDVLEKRILRDFEESKNKTISNSLKLLLPLSLIGEVLSRAQISGDKKVNSVTRTERAALIKIIKNFELKVESLRCFDEAIVTSGGINVGEINPKTMESNLIKGLYFCGEVLDVDALTGGFNLQIAFSTGYAAGNSIKI